MKKVLSLVLVLTLVLGSFSMVFAADNATTGLSDVSGNANEEAITVVNDLGIVTGYTDGTFKPANNVTRAEFAAMMTRALAIPESALAGYATTSFKDVAADNWAVKYLAFCDAKGIMLGDGNGNAMPNRTINVNEAVTMILRAVGYTNNSSVLVGSWPSNYVSLAQDLGIYDDVAATATVDRASAAQIVYNALDVTKVQVGADGKTEDVKVFDKTANAGAGAWVPTNMLTSGLKCSEDTVASLIDGTEASLINLTPYIGTQGYLIKNADGKIVAVKGIESVYLTVEKYAAGATTFKTPDGTKYYEKVDANVVNSDFDNLNVALFTNGVIDTTTPTTNAFQMGDIISAKVSGTTVKEIYAVQRWNAPDATFQHEANSFYEAKAKYGTISLPTNKDDSINYDAFTVVGASSIANIPVDAVVYVYKYTSGDNNGKIAKIVVGTETVTGTISKYVQDVTYVNRFDAWTINGVAYNENTAGVNVLTGTNELGQEGTALLDGYGKLYKWTQTDNKAGNYALVVKVGQSTDNYASSNFVVKMVDATGAEAEYVVKDAAAATPAATALYSSVSSGAGMIVNYALDTNGKIKELTTCAIQNFYGGSFSSTIIGKTPIKSNAVMWKYNATDDVYELASVADIDSDIKHNTDDATYGYGVVKDGYYVAMFAKAACLTGTTNSFGVINDGAQTYDADQDAVVWYIDGYADGVEFEAQVTNVTGSTCPLSATGAGTVLYKFAKNSDGVVVPTLVVDNSDVATVVAIQHNPGTTTVTGVDGGMVTVDNGTTTDYYTLASGFVAYVYNEDDGIFDAQTTLSTNDVKGLSVKFYQTDDDVNGYDIVVVYPE